MRLGRHNKSKHITVTREANVQVCWLSSCPINVSFQLIGEVVGEDIEESQEDSAGSGVWTVE